MDMSSMMMISMRLGTMMKMNRLSSYRATLWRRMILNENRIIKLE
jgi:hypothetical protein